MPHRSLCVCVLSHSSFPPIPNEARARFTPSLPRAAPSAHAGVWHSDIRLWGLGSTVNSGGKGASAFLRIVGMMCAFLQNRGRVFLWCSSSEALMPVRCIFVNMVFVECTKGSSEILVSAHIWL